MCFLVAIAGRAGDAASFVSKKISSPAVMFTSRLVLPSAMTWTEGRLCRELATLTHARARFLLLAVLWCCCCIAVGSGAASTAACSRVLSPHHLYRKNERTKERHKKQRKQRTSGRFFSPTAYFLVGNYGLRRAERWDDIPSMSSEVGEI